MTPDIHKATPHYGFEWGWAAAFLFCAAFDHVPWWLAAAALLGSVLSALLKRVLW